MNNNETKDLTLNIFISNTEITISINNNDNSILFSKQILSSLSGLNTNLLIESLKSHPEFKISYNNISAFVDSDAYMLIPAEIENHNHIFDLFHFQFPDIDMMAFQLEQNKLDIYNARIIYSIRKDIQSAFRSIYPDIAFKHTVGDFIERKQRADASLLINYKQNFADFVLFRNNQIVLAKRNTHTCDEDLLYNALSVLEILKADSDTTPTVVTGTDKNSGAFLVLQKYLKQLHLDTNNK